MKLKGLSLFANVGIAETYLNQIGIHIAIANDIDKKRMQFYKEMYPDCQTITGSIINNEIQDELIEKSKKIGVDFIIATPPCQGMSVAGKRTPLDPRNQLIFYAIKIIKKIKPRYIFLENVPQQQKTKILFNNKITTIPEYLNLQLKKEYIFNKENLISCMDHSIPQIRKRNIFLLTRKDQKKIWEFPKKDKKIITLEDAIGDLPSVDPFIREGYKTTIKYFPDFDKKKKIALNHSKHHAPPTHCERHVKWMMHTPTGCTAFDNKIYYPQKKGGIRINGHKNTYRRHRWDSPSRTIIMNNGVISSLCCVHPGRIINDPKNVNLKLYSDPRVLTLLEIFIVFSLPRNWNYPDWASENFVRKIIGEGIPPLLVKKIFKQLIDQLK